MVVKQLYWTVRKRPSLKRHVLTAIARAMRNAAALGRRKLLSGGRPMVAIGLIEHMGDIAAAEPFARAAREQFPNARIVWVTREAYRGLPDAYPDVDETIVVQCLSEWLLLWSFGLFDAVWDLHLNDRRCPICDVGHVKHGLAGEITYQTYYNFGSLTAVQAMVAGLEAVEMAPTLETSPATRRAVDALGLPGSFVVLHAKSNDTSRDWDLSKWATLVDHLGTTYPGHIVEIGSSAQVIGYDTPGRTNLCGRLSILESAEVIRRACLFVGIDSGPAHLANAVGTPGVILIGDYNNFRNHMPYSGFYATAAGATILRADGPVAILDEADVIRAIDARLHSTASHDDGIPALFQPS